MGHKAVVLDELKSDLKKGTSPLKSAANMMTKAGQLCSTDFLTTEEWHNFIREVASHEAMTRDDVEYLRASKDIYEAKYRLDTVLIAISQRIYRSSNWRALQFGGDKIFHYCTIPIMNHPQAFHTELLALRNIIER